MDRGGAVQGRTKWGLGTRHDLQMMCYRGVGQWERAVAEWNSGCEYARPTQGPGHVTGSFRWAPVSEASPLAWAVGERRHVGTEVAELDARICTPGVAQVGAQEDS